VYALAHASDHLLTIAPLMIGHLSTTPVMVSVSLLAAARALLGVSEPSALAAAGFFPVTRTSYQSGVSADWPGVVPKTGHVGQAGHPPS